MKTPAGCGRGCCAQGGVCIVKRLAAYVVEWTLSLAPANVNLPICAGTCLSVLYSHLIRTHAKKGLKGRK